MLAAEINLWPRFIRSSTTREVLQVLSISQEAYYTPLRLTGRHVARREPRLGQLESVRLATMKVIQHSSFVTCLDAFIILCTQAGCYSLGARAVQTCAGRMPRRHVAVDQPLQKVRRFFGNQQAQLDSISNMSRSDHNRHVVVRRRTALYC